MDAEKVIDLALEKLKEIAEIFDQFEGKDKTTFLEMSVNDEFIWANLLSVKKCDQCNKMEPVIHKYKYVDRK